MTRHLRLVHDATKSGVTVLPFPTLYVTSREGNGAERSGDGFDVHTFAGAWGLAISGFVIHMQAAGLSAQTVRLRRHYLERVAEDLGTATPWDVTADRLTWWLSRPEWAPETRKSARASVTTFYRWAVDTDRIPAHASPARRLPPVTVPHTAPRPAPDRVLTPALWSGTDRDRLFLMLAAYAGLRRGEIAAVHPGDIDHETRQLHVRGKGRRERWVPLHDDLYAELVAELERRSAGRHGSGYRYGQYVEPGGWLFPGRTGHVTPDVPGRVVADLLGNGWTAHSLRHRFASQAYAVERDLRAVQELLGHSKPETTARYVRTPQGAMRAAVRGVGVPGPRDAA
jgi:integrase/recombinase XerC